MFQPKKSPCWWLKPGGLSKWSDWSGQSHSPAWTAPNLAGNSCRIWPWLKDGFTDTRAFTAVCAYDHAWTLAKIGTYMSFTNGTHAHVHNPEYDDMGVHRPLSFLDHDDNIANQAGMVASPLNPNTKNQNSESGSAGTPWSISWSVQNGSKPRDGWRIPTLPWSPDDLMTYSACLHDGWLPDLVIWDPFVAVWYGSGNIKVYVYVLCIYMDNMFLYWDYKK